MSLRLIRSYKENPGATALPTLLAAVNPAGTGAILLPGHLRELSPLAIATEPARLQAVREWLPTAEAGEHELMPEGVIIAPPVLPGETSVVICKGLNYREHATQSGLALQPHPVWFPRMPHDIVGPYHQIPVPPADPRQPDAAVRFDYEVELVIVTRKFGTRIPVERALDYVAGYTLGGDYSERTRQTRGPQWAPGKILSYSAPLGPIFEIPDEGEADINSAGRGRQLLLSVNKERRQTGITSDMAFSVAELIADLSNHSGIVPGMVIFTGTPSGCAFQPNRKKAETGLPADGQGHLYLNEQLAGGGLVHVEASIDGLGTQFQQIVNWTGGWDAHFAAGSPFRDELHSIGWRNEFLGKLAA